MRIPRNVVALGIVSLLTDLSTEMILPVLPLFITVTLGASAASLGVIEGVAESVSSLLRLVSGRLGDRVAARKPLVVAGYGLSGAAKAALALVSSWPAVMALRVSDRLGKGLRNPPRDALIADSVEPSGVGAAFGFHRALDTTGAVLGPLAAWALMTMFPGEFRRVFAWSLLPAALSVLVLLVMVRTPPVRAEAVPAPAVTTGSYGPAFGRFLLVAGLFSLANSSTAFLLLRAKGLGFGVAQVPLLYLAYNVVYAALAYPIGAWTDRVGRRPALLAAYLMFAAVYGLLALAPTTAPFIAAFLVLGVHNALLDGSQRSMVSDLVPRERKAGAFGVYYAVTGLALLPASAVAGALWDRFGPRAAFLTDAVIAALAAILFAVLLPNRREREERNASTA